MKHSLLSILLAGTVLSGGALYAVANAAENQSADMPKIEHEFNREEMHKKMAEKMAKDLDLTEAQKEQAKAIREKGKKEIEPLMDEMKNLREKMDEKRRANMQEFEQILTPEQKAKFEELKKNAPHQGERNMKKRHEGGFRHHGPKMGPRGAKFDAKNTSNAE